MLPKILDFFKDKKNKMRYYKGRRKRKNKEIGYESKKWPRFY